MVETISQVYETKRIQIRTQLEGERFKVTSWLYYHFERAILECIALAEPVSKCFCHVPPQFPHIEKVEWRIINREASNADKVSPIIRALRHGSNMTYHGSNVVLFVFLTGNRAEPGAERACA